MDRAFGIDDIDDIDGIDGMERIKKVLWYLTEHNLSPQDGRMKQILLSFADFFCLVQTLLGCDSAPPKKVTVRQNCSNVPAIRPAGISYDFGGCALSPIVARQIALRVPSHPRLYPSFRFDCGISQNAAISAGFLLSFIPYSYDKVKHFSKNQALVKFTYSPFRTCKKLL